MTELISFEKLADGRIRLVGAWPAHATFSQALLDESDSKHIRCDGRVVTITVDNAEASYVLGATSPDFFKREGRLVRSRQVWANA